MLALSNIRRISLVNVFLASLSATTVVTITMLMSGTDIVRVLGGMLLGADTSVTARYLVGGVVHLSVGITYGVLFALFFAPVSEWNKTTKGVIFGFFITVMALVFMPLGASMLSGKPAMQAANPCTAAVTNPCNPCMSNATNPCETNNPCASKSMNPCAAVNPCSVGHTKPIKMAQPCNPCAPKMTNPCAVGNPCSAGHTTTMKMAQPCNPCAPKMSNPCATGNPCNPCGGGGGDNVYGGLISLLNHIGLALVLAFTIKLRTNKFDKAA